MAAPPWNRSVLLLILSSAAVAQHNCIHDTHIVPSLLAHKHFPLDVSQEPPGRRLSSNLSEVLGRRLVAGGSALRIFVDYTYLDRDKYACTEAGVKASTAHGEEVECTEKDLLDEAKKDHIKKLVGEATTWFTKALRLLHPPPGPLKVRKFCYHLAPPPNGDADTPIDSSCFFFHGPRCIFEVDANYYLTVTASPRKGHTAYAAACQNDKETGRPIAGLINFGPASISLDASKYKSQLRTAIHELSHAFGFSATSYARFIDAEGERLGEDNVVRSFQTRGKTVKKIITPRVVEAVKRQYGCFDWPDVGGELEDHTASTPSHWEKRTFRDEYMTSTAEQDPVISAISLALFEDTGWYVPDYLLAEHLKWGHDQGCTFPREKCDKWDDRFFCVNKKVKSCSHRRFHKAYCNVKEFENDLPIHSRYFPKNSKKGGADDHADYCPYYRGYAKADCRFVEHQKKKAAELWGELNGATSRCFDSTILNDDYDTKDDSGLPRQRCYPRTCKDGKLFVYVNAEPIECPHMGGPIESTAKGYGGTLWCPPASELCDDNAEAEEPLLKGAEFMLLSAGNGEHATEQPKVDLEPAGAPVDIELGPGETLYLVVDLSVHVTGDLALLFEDDAVHGELYVRVEEEEEDDEPVPIRKRGAQEAAERRLQPSVMKLWPSKDHYDLREKVNGVTRVDLEGIITQSSSGLLLAFAASDNAVAKGRVSLQVACPGECVNGGVCSVRGVCQCPNGFGGVLCKERSCPDDCSGQGSCDTARGLCNCNFGFEGENCMIVSETTGHHTPELGKVPVGAWAYFFVTCDDASNRSADTVGQSAELTYFLEKEGCPLADPFLFAGLGREKPTETLFAERALSSWRSAANSHKLLLHVRTGPWGGATIGVYNTAAYGKELLKYRGKSTCTLKGQPRPCPSTSLGECNGKGTCSSAVEDNTKVCNCVIGWAGTACDERKVELTAEGSQVVGGLKLHEAGAVFLKIVMRKDALHKNLKVAIKGPVDFTCISVNAGARRPLRQAPRRTNYHNFRSIYEWEVGKDSELTIPDIDNALYTVMVTNPKLTFIQFDVQVTLFSARPDPAVLAKQAEMEEPQVPLYIVGTNGKLPESVLMMSSRTGVGGVASSAHMRLLSVNEFCSRSRTGLYIKCSSMEGTMHICTDKPAVAYHKALHDRQPRDISQFQARETSALGLPSKHWAHLHAGEACNYLLKIPIQPDNRYVGVAALKKGQYVNFLATMTGKKTFFFNDAGGLRDEIYVTLWCLGTSLCTAACVSSLCFGVWHRKLSQRERAEAAASRFALRWASATRQAQTSGTELTLRQVM